MIDASEVDSRRWSGCGPGRSSEQEEAACMLLAAGGAGAGASTSSRTRNWPRSKRRWRRPSAASSPSEEEVAAVFDRYRAMKSRSARTGAAADRRHLRLMSPDEARTASRGSSRASTCCRRARTISSAMGRETSFAVRVVTMPRLPVSDVLRVAARSRSASLHVRHTARRPLRRIDDRPRPATEAEACAVVAEAAARRTPLAVDRARAPRPRSAGRRRRRRPCRRRASPASRSTSRPRW